VAAGTAAVFLLRGNGRSSPDTDLGSYSGLDH
jgi:hypothetical protein